MLKINANGAVSFADLIGTQYPVKNFTQDEFNFLPRTTKRNWRSPDGWERTGYLSPNDVMVGHGNFIYWTYHEFIRTVPGPTDDFDRPTTRPETKTYIVHVDGQLLMHHVADQYDEKEWEEIPVG